MSVNKKYAANLRAEIQVAIARGSLPTFVKLRLTGLTRGMLQKWVAQKDCGLKRISNLLLPLRGMYAQALEDDLIANGTFVGWPRARSRCPRLPTTSARPRERKLAPPWRRGLVRFASVPDRYAYQTRHTFASTLLSAGENPVWVTSMMGHKDWAKIIRVDGRWISSIVPDAGNEVAALWAKPGSNTSAN